MGQPDDDHGAGAVKEEDLEAAHKDDQFKSNDKRDYEMLKNL